MDNVSYEWKPEDEFKFDGVQFSFLVNASRDFLNTQESQKVLMVKAISDLLEQKLKQGIEDGIVKSKEVSKDVKSQN